MSSIFNVFPLRMGRNMGRQKDSLDTGRVKIKAGLLAPRDALEREDFKK